MSNFKTVLGNFRKRNQSLCSFLALGYLEPRMLFSTWQGGNGLWSDQGHWDFGVPDEHLPAIIDTSVTVQIPVAGAAAAMVTICRGPSMKLNANGSQLNVTSQFEVWGPSSVEVYNGSVVAETVEVGLGYGPSMLHLAGDATITARDSTVIGYGLVTGTGLFNGDVETLGIDATLQPGDDNPLGSLYVNDDADLADGFTFSAQISSAPDEWGYNSNALCVNGGAALGGSIQGYGTHQVQILLNQIDNGNLRPGMQFPIIVANGFSGGFTGYSWGDPLNITPVPSPHYDLYWALNIVPASFSGCDYSLDAYGSAFALVLEVRAGSGYGNSMMQNAIAPLTTSPGLLAAALDGKLLVSSSSVAPTVGANTAILNAPADLVAAKAGNFGVNLRWSYADGGQIGFEIQRKADDGSWLTVATTRGSIRSWIDTRVRSGITYDYRIRVLGRDNLEDSEFTELLAPIVN
jgi:hypothetical protein